MTSLAEELFPPRPGGMVDQTRRQNTETARQHPTAGTAEHVYRGNHVAVRTKAEVPVAAGAATYVLPAGPYSQQVLGNDVNRRRSVVCNGGTVGTVIATSRAAADDPRNASADSQGASGFYLAAGSQVVLEYQGEVYLAAGSTAATCPVSVWTELYADTAA